MFTNVSFYLFFRQRKIERGRKKERRGLFLCFTCRCGSWIVDDGYRMVGLVDDGMVDGGLVDMVS